MPSALSIKIFVSPLCFFQTCIEVRTKKEKNVVPSVGSVVTVRVSYALVFFSVCSI
jgi:hypothetical protein